MGFSTAPARAATRKSNWQRVGGISRFLRSGQAGGDAGQQPPYGIQRKVEIARALAAEPTLLILDEPAAGLNDSETLELVETIYKIREKGVTVLLIEHDMDMVMTLTDYITVINFGKKIAEGTPAEVQKSQGDRSLPGQRG